MTKLCCRANKKNPLIIGKSKKKLACNFYQNRNSLYVLLIFSFSIQLRSDFDTACSLCSYIWELQILLCRIEFKCTLFCHHQSQYCDGAVSLVKLHSNNFVFHSKFTQQVYTLRPPHSHSWLRLKWVLMWFVIGSVLSVQIQISKVINRVEGLPLAPHSDCVRDYPSA